jgi:hypothetical protein
MLFLALTIIIFYAIIGLGRERKSTTDAPSPTSTKGVLFNPEIGSYHKDPFEK